MKKVLAMMLCCLFLMGNFSFAENNFNVDDYTDDELISIMCSIYEAETQLGYLYSNEILRVGTDIPAGSYEFWVEESDIGFSKDMIDDPLDYHCGYTKLCTIWWSNKEGEMDYNKCESIYYDQYGVRIKVKLKRGQYLWTTQRSGGANYVGLRMKYFPNRRSGLFSN